MPLYWSRALYSLLMVLALVIITGCSGLETKRLKDPLSPALASPPEFLGVRHRAMLQHALELESSALQAAFSDLRRRGDWRNRGYFSAQEHDEMEGLLFRFAVNHSTFWGEFDRSGGARMLHVAEEEKPRAHVLLLHAGFALSDSSAFLVAEFQDDPIAISKINEAFYRS